MKERPIIFSGPMVRAILEGRKTQTRRVMKTPPDTFEDAASVLSACPFGKAGDRLWVRETWSVYTDGHARGKGDEVILYRADDSAYWNMHPLEHMEAEFNPLRDACDFSPKWRPSIHMPRWASRITLEIASVRVELLQAISEADAKAEGTTPDRYTDHPRGIYYTAFAELWKSINGPDSWSLNPWVWVIEFEKVTGEA